MTQSPQAFWSGFERWNPFENLGVEHSLVIPVLGEKDSWGSLGSQPSLIGS